MNKRSFHVLFWIFIFLYEFDYLIDLYGFSDSILYSAFEVSIYCIEFYINLIILMPLVLKPKGKIAYAISLFLLFCVTISIYYVTGIQMVLSLDNLPRAVISFLLNHSLFIFISYIIWYFEKYFSERHLRLELENDKLKSEMKMLKTQISPHFLFNTLNNIYALTLEKSDNAPKMIATLADILRYLIYESGIGKTPLTSEIEVIQKYIQIQRYRQIVGMNNINFTTPQSKIEKMIPPLLFITMVENAFKHGDIIFNKKGFVDIQLETTGENISFTVTNSYVTVETKSGIGLQNLESQLKILFDKNYNLLIEDANSIFKVSLSFHA